MGMPRGDKREREGGRTLGWDEDVGCVCCGAGDPRGGGWGLSGDLLVGNGELPCLCLCCACAGVWKQEGHESAIGVCCFGGARGWE